MFLILAVTIVMAGCVEHEAAAPRRPLAIDGLTLADLQPTVAETQPPVLMFMVIGYLADEPHAEAVRGCFDSLPQSPIRFRDKTAFEANGLWAAHGTGMAMGPVGDCLLRMGAEQYGQTALMLNPGMNSAFSKVFIDEQAVAYVSAEGDKRTVSLRNGVLGWVLTAQREATAAGRVRVTIKPVFSPQGIMNWPGAERLAQQLGHRFEDLGFEVLLGEADFVMLSVNRDAFDEMSELERLLFMHPGKRDKVFIYAIICAQVQR
jgi:hypothetical protein